MQINRYAILLLTLTFVSACSREYDYSKIPVYNKSSLVWGGSLLSVEEGGEKSRRLAYKISIRQKEFYTMIVGDEIAIKAVFPDASHPEIAIASQKCSGPVCSWNDYVIMKMEDREPKCEGSPCAFVKSHFPKPKGFDNILLLGKVNKISYRTSPKSYEIKITADFGSPLDKDSKAVKLIASSEYGEYFIREDLLEYLSGLIKAEDFSEVFANKILREKYFELTEKQFSYLNETANYYYNRTIVEGRYYVGTACQMYACGYASAIVIVDGLDKKSYILTREGYAEEGKFEYFSKEPMAEFLEIYKKIIGTPVGRESEVFLYGDKDIREYLDHLVSKSAGAQEARQ